MDRMNEIQIFQDDKGTIIVEVLVDKETVWLSLNQMSQLFGRDKTVILRHIKNIFKDCELIRETVVANFATTAKDEKIYQVDYYNLDMIISVGYRVNSKVGIQFRKWANRVLKDYLINGYALNQKKLAIEGIDDVQRSLELLTRTLINENLLNDIGKSAISLIKQYSKTWQVLLQYDEDKLSLPSVNKENGIKLNITAAKAAINDLKVQLIDIGEATELFGIDKENNLESILNNIEQTFGEELLYPAIIIRAAHLLYFIIKDHPFVDGNKRIGCLLFVLYLTINKVSLVKINDASLTALALLTAESNPIEKELIIKLITTLITV